MGGVGTLFRSRYACDPHGVPNGELFDTTSSLLGSSSAKPPKDDQGRASNVDSTWSTAQESSAPKDPDTAGRRSKTPTGALKGPWLNEALLRRLPF